MANLKSRVFRLIIKSEADMFITEEEEKLLWSQFYSTISGQRFEKDGLTIFILSVDEFRLGKNISEFRIRCEMIDENYSTLQRSDFYLQEFKNQLGNLEQKEKGFRLYITDIKEGGL